MQYDWLSQQQLGFLYVLVKSVLLYNAETWTLPIMDGPVEA